MNDPAVSGLNSLDQFVRAVISECEPCMQNTSDQNLGFGWLYYGLVRNARPKFVVAIGSRKGFMPFCAARAVKDNGVGKVLFIDPGFSGGDHPGWAGIGFWTDLQRVQAWIDRFDLTGWIEHLPMKSSDALPIVRERVGDAGLGMVIIDGDHTYEGCLRDYEMYAPLLVDRGLTLFHDAISPWCDVPKVLDHLRSRGLPVVTVAKEVGLSILETRRPPPVETTWSYLVDASDRGAKLADLLRPFLKEGDSLLEMYCGLSPLPPHLPSVRSWFGYDLDPLVIATCRRRFPDWGCSVCSVALSAPPPFLRSS